MSNICHAIVQVIVMLMYVVEPRYWRFFLCVVIPAIVCNLESVSIFNNGKLVKVNKINK
jgi:uncharacterized protein (DUF983 family)